MNQLSKNQKIQKLTKKQREFVKDYAVHENATQAVLKNYDVKDNIVAKSIGSENLSKPYIVEAIRIEQISLRQALIDSGITPQKISERVGILLHAKDKDGYDDHTAIDKGLKHATTIYGVVDESERPVSLNNTYNFIFSKEVQDDVKQIEDRIKQKLINSNVPKN